jgi:hypothetical protein
MNDLRNHEMLLSLTDDNGNPATEKGTYLAITTVQGKFEITLHPLSGDLILTALSTGKRSLSITPRSDNSILIMEH